MWTYAQKTGNLFHDGRLVATGYSGNGEGKNDPLMQGVHDCGPIPRGKWTIDGPPVNTVDRGPYVLFLTAGPDTNTFGRSGFHMHGDSVRVPGSGSRGCIVMPRTAREEVWNSGDTDLEVVPELETRD